MADQFGGIEVEDKPASDQFGGLPVEQSSTQSATPSPPISGPDGWHFGTGPESVAVAKTVYPSLGPILSAFGSGAKDGWGNEPLGLPTETVKYLSDKKIFGPAQGGYDNPFQAFNELLAQTVVGAAQIAGRAGSAAFGMYQAGVAATGEQVGAPVLGRDLAAMPEAFFGLPGSLGEIKLRSGLPHDEPLGRTAPAPIVEPVPNGTVTVKPVDGFSAFHGSPYSFDAFSTAHIGNGEGAQSYGHGLYFAENPDVAGEYANKLSNGEKGNHYQVSILADRGKFLDLDKSLNQQTPFVQDALKKAMGEEKFNQFQYADGKTAVRNGFIAFDDPSVSQKLSEAGIPGSKYFDSDSRRAYVASERDAPRALKSIDEAQSQIKAIQEEVANNKDNMLPAYYARQDAAISELQDRIKNWQSMVAGRTDLTRNYVVFNEGDVQITHKNGEAIPSPMDRINEARDLGVIGPPKPDMADASPAARAEAEVPKPAVAAASRAGDSISEPVGAPEKAGNIRLDQIGINGDAKDVILDAAKNNDDFNQARQGNVPLAQVESLSNASGIPSETLTANDGLGRLMHNDAVVRTWLQAFHQASDEIAEQSRKAAAGDPTEIDKMRQMTLRFQHMQEQVSGLTAEAGRTLGVFREFYAKKANVDAISKALEENPHLDDASIQKLADTVRGLNSPEAVGKYLNATRQPTFWDKYLYHWVNALISGPVTHLKYIGANAAFGAYEAGVVTPVAGALGTVRRLAGGTDGVYVGEAAARTWGLLAGTPDALKAAWTAAKENVMTPLPGELAKAQAEASQQTGELATAAVRNAPGFGTEDIMRFEERNRLSALSRQNPMTQIRPNPVGGKLGFAIGIPGRSAAGIHSFFRFLGYRAEIEAQAYRQAAKEGLSPANQQFWERRAALVDNPTEAMMDAGIDNGNHLTFIGEQGEFGKAIAKLANTRMGPGGMQPFKLILPFTHIPGQILRAGLEQTPAAFLDSEMRADLLGKNGAVKADTARARLIAGGVVAGMVANYALNDSLTGYGPTDPTERAQWLRTHEPYSVRLGGWWYSYNKFGPIGDLVGLTANLVEVGPKMGEGEYGEAAGHVVKATSRMLEDEVGMQGLVNLLDAMSDPDRKMSQFVAQQAASNLPYSSLLRQTASFNDPYMREAKTFVDELRYSVPFGRQDLLPKLDWLGQPVDNPAYHSILRQRAVNADPVDLAVSQLRGFKPAPPEARIGGVALPPGLYHEYQARAGALTKAGLEPYVTSPGWGTIPPGIRESIIHGIVEKARQTAAGMMQATHQELIMQGISNRQDKITGAKPTKLTD